MNALISLFLSFGLVVTPIPQITAEVTEIVNDRAVVFVTVDRGYIEDVYGFDFPVVENSFEPEIENAFVGQKMDVKTVCGTFYGTWEGVNCRGDKEIFHQFKAFDDSVWWALTVDDLGFVPIDGKIYVLVYDENKDTEENHTCPSDLDCDCYAYDDLFLGVYEI